MLIELSWTLLTFGDNGRIHAIEIVVSQSILQQLHILPETKQHVFFVRTITTSLVRKRQWNTDAVSLCRARARSVRLLVSRDTCNYLSIYVFEMRMKEKKMPMRDYKEEKMTRTNDAYERKKLIFISRYWLHWRRQTLPMNPPERERETNDE